MSKYELKHISKRSYKQEIKFAIATCGIIVGVSAATVVGCMIGGERAKSRIDDIKKHHQNHELSYEELSNCSLLELQIGVSKKLYMCKKERKVDQGTIIYSYTTLNDNTNIYNEKAVGGEKYDTLDVVDLVKKNDNIEDYLVNFDYVKEWYTPDDIDNIMSQIYRVYSYSNNKVKYKVK